MSILKPERLTFTYRTELTWIIDGVVGRICFSRSAGRYLNC